MKMNRHTLAIALLVCLATPPLAHAAAGRKE
jgi:hypothetical protein